MTTGRIIPGVEGRSNGLRQIPPHECNISQSGINNGGGGGLCPVLNSCLWRILTFSLGQDNLVLGQDKDKVLFSRVGKYISKDKTFLT